MIDIAKQSWRLALIDLDGTLYSGDTVIPGAPESIERLRDAGIKPIYFTNNSSRTPDEVAHKLRNMGFSASDDEVVTSAQMSAHLLAHRLEQGASVAYIGGNGLREALTAAGLEPIYVPSADDTALASCAGAALGIDQTVSYLHLARFCDVTVRNGWFLLTNADVRLPHGDGFLPGNGALGRFVATATGLEPVIAGKPEPEYVAYAIARYGCTPEETVIIGDNVLTDILAAKRAGIASIMVRTGVQYDDADSVPQPTFTTNSIADL